MNYDELRTWAYELEAENLRLKRELISMGGKAKDPIPEPEMCRSCREPMGDSGCAQIASFKPPDTSGPS